jgi:hypothetical protein
MATMKRQTMASTPAPVRYATMSRVAKHGLGADVSIGSLAQRDIVVSSASLLASQIIRDASTQTSVGGQLRVIRSALNKIKPGLAQKFNDQYRLLATGGARGTQVTFNAARLVIANVLADEAIEQIKAMVAATTGHTLGLGQTTPASPDYTGSDIACGIMSGLSALTGIVGGATHTSTTDATGAMQGASNNFCGARTAANAAAQIEAQNQQTAANLAMAQQNALIQQQTLEAQAGQSATMVKLALIGGGVLLVGLVGVAVVKKM